MVGTNWNRGMTELYAKLDKSGACCNILDDLFVGYMNNISRGNNKV